MANHRLLSGSDYKLETGLRTGYYWFCVSSFLGSELSAIGRLWNLNESFIWLRLSWWVIIKHLCEGIENHKLNQGSNNFCISYFWGLRNYVNILCQQTKRCQQFWIKRQHSINGYPGDQIFYTLSNGVKYIECHLIRVTWVRSKARGRLRNSATQKKSNESSVEIIGHFYRILVSHFLGLRNNKLRTLIMKFVRAMKIEIYA